ncbi:MAG: succinate dehydrogenase assembly factor 2 [Methylocystis sp.]|nr:succinate dehydrogenase assembly factor 2 [Methylocystis sp.]MBI3275927.1 succinate dehydrogenase assembly factor 2 [Methylocystis sp.]
MTGALEADDLDIRRRRIRLRAWRRGMREMDIIIGGFVDAELDRLDAQEVADLEALMELPDDNVFRWLSRTESVPPAHDTPLFRKIATFHSHDAPLHS